MNAPDTSLMHFLREQNLAVSPEDALWKPLDGGVSSDIWHVQAGDRNFCVKRALAQLKTAATWNVPIGRNAFEWEYIKIVDRIAPGHVPRPLAHDPERGLFAMAWLPPATNRLWKTELLAGHVNPDDAAAVGALIGRIHASTTGDPSLRTVFATDDNFHAIRIEPYLLATAEKHQDIAPYLQVIADVTSGIRAVLVHGDVSPKNILLGASGPVLLDAECAWFGDPAFDLAFCLNHLAIKARFLTNARQALSASFDALSAHYLAKVTWEAPASVERRAALLLPCLALARVDGKSPVEYLDDTQRDSLRGAARQAIQNRHTSLSDAKAALLG